MRASWLHLSLTKVNQTFRFHNFSRGASSITRINLAIIILCKNSRREAATGSFLWSWACKNRRKSLIVGRRRESWLHARWILKLRRVAREVKAKTNKKFNLMYVAGPCMSKLMAGGHFMADCSRPIYADGIVPLCFTPGHHSLARATGLMVSRVWLIEWRAGFRIICFLARWYSMSTPLRCSTDCIGALGGQRKLEQYKLNHRALRDVKYFWFCLRLVFITDFRLGDLLHTFFAFSR